MRRSDSRSAAARSTRAARSPGIRAALFDVDGVLADTARLHTAAWRRLADEEGLPFDDRLADQLRGVSREESLRRILNGRRVSDVNFRAMMDRKNACYQEFVARLTGEDALPGARVLLEDLADEGVTCAAVSISRNARQVLAQLELSPLLKVIIDGNDAAQSRTGLDRYLLAAAALRCDPRKCVVFEDSTAGIALARRAGMVTIGLGEPRRLAAADMIFDSLRGVSGRLLLRWLETLRSGDGHATSGTSCPRLEITV